MVIIPHIENKVNYFERNYLQQFTKFINFSFQDKRNKHLILQTKSKTNKKSKINLFFLSYISFYTCIIKHMKSKTIIISSQHDNEKGRGVLTIYMEDDLLKCKLRLYNTPNLNRYCKLGIYHQNEVFSANLLEKNGSYTSSMVGNFDIEKDFYSAIIDTSNNNNVILSGGTYSGYFFNDQSVFEKENKHIFDNVEKENPNTNIYSYEDNEIDYIEKNINPKSLNNSCEDDCKKCENCKYKEYFYSQKEISQSINLKKTHQFKPTKMWKT